jgi:hypothetical protein
MNNKNKTIAILTIGIIRTILGIICAILFYKYALKLDTMVVRGGPPIDASIYRFYSFMAVLYSLSGIGIIYLRNFARKLSIYFDFLIISLCILTLMIFGKGLFLDFSLPQVRLTWFLAIICGAFIICLTRPRLKNIFK